MLRATVDDELIGLEALNTEALKERWRGLYGADPPKGLSAKLMRKAIGFEIQVKAYGPCKPAIRKELKRALGGANGAAARTPNHVASGSRLIREWHGDTYVVDISEDGVRWRDRSYSSLSAVAREITGTRWNGRKFFGLSEGMRGQ